MVDNQLLDTPLEAKVSANEFQLYSSVQSDPELFDELFFELPLDIPCEQPSLAESLKSARRADNVEALEEIILSTDLSLGELRSTIQALRILNPRRVIELADSVLRKHDACPPAVAEVTKAYVVCEDYQAGVDLYDSFLRDSPERRKMMAAKSYLSHLGKLNNGHTPFHERDQFSESPSTLYMLTDLYTFCENVDCAISWAEFSSEKFPSHHKSFHNLAMLRILKGEYEKAPEAALRAAENAALCFLKRKDATLSLILSGRCSEAAAYAEESLQRFPKHNDALVLNVIACFANSSASEVSSSVPTKVREAVGLLPTDQVYCAATKALLLIGDRDFKKAASILENREWSHKRNRLLAYWMRHTIALGFPELRSQYASDFENPQPPKHLTWGDWGKLRLYFDQEKEVSVSSLSKLISWSYAQHVLYHALNVPARTLQDMPLPREFAQESL